MNYYLEITLLPDVEIPLYFLWEKVYQQLHLAFVEQAFEKEVDVDNSGNKKRIKVSKIGISFPDYDIEKHQLGHKLRLFAETDVLLARFNASEWLANLKDYVDLTNIEPVPEKIEKYACFYRIQPKSNHERLIRRRDKRLNKPNQNLEKEIPFSFPNFFYKEDFGSYQEQRTKAPFINIKSSKAYRFRLFIGYIEQTEKHYAGFSCYGLSRKSTVPIF